jgi:hypothetical protein
MLTMVLLEFRLAAMEPTAERWDDTIVTITASGQQVAAAMEPTAERWDDADPRHDVMADILPQWCYPSLVLSAAGQVSAICSGRGWSCCVLAG